MCLSARLSHAHAAVLPPPLAGEGWGGGELARVFVRAPSLSLPRKRGRGRCGADASHKSQRAVSDKAKIAIATGDPAGIGPEISLKAALDPAVRAACEPIIVSDARLVERHAEPAASRPICASSSASATRTGRRRGERARLPAARGRGARLWRHQRGGGRASIAFCARRDQGRDGGRGRCGGGRAAERDLDRAGRHRVRRPSVVRGARDRHRRERRLPDALLRRHQDRACTLHRSVRDAIALITRDNVSRAIIRATDARAASARHRRAGDRGQRAQSARRRRRAVRPRGDRDHQAGDRGRRRAMASRSPARSAPTPCFTCRASTPSSSCCTTRATSPRSCWRRTPPPR